MYKINIGFHVTIVQLKRKYMSRDVSSN